MPRRAAIILVILFAALIGVAGYFIQRDKKVVVVDPWVAVPSDAIFIVETPDFPELLTEVTDRNGLIMRLTGMKWASNLVSAASFVDSITGSRELRGMMNGRKVLLSFHPGGQGRIAPLAVMNTTASFSFRQLKQIVSRSGATVSDLRELGGTKVLSAMYGKGIRKNVVYIALTSGILIVSPSETLVTNALNNKNTGSDIRHQQGFTSVVNSSGKGMDNLFVLFRNLPRFAQSFINPEKITPLSAVAIAAGGDVTSRDEGMFLSGFLSTAGSGQGADRLKNIVPAEPGVHEVLPRGTLSYQTLMRRPVITGASASVPEAINATDLALAVSSFTDAEVTNAVIPVDRRQVRVILFRMSDRVAAETILKERLTSKYKSLGLKESQFMATLKQDDGEQVVIYKLPFTGVASMLSGETTGAPEDNWVLFCRSYMIFAPSPEVLVEIQKQSDNDSTLINDPDFREMEKTLPTKSSFLFYSSGRAIREMLNGFLTPAAAGVITDNTFSGIDGIGLSLSPSNEMIYTSLSFRYRDASQAREAGLTATTITTGQSSTEEDRQDSNYKWKAKLQADLAIKPFFFTNHNTGAKEIFVQDLQNNIYLISSNGKILWKASIRERIRGDVFMIDYYRNGKNQLLFSGKEYLHLIDRNGNYVDKFPVKLKSPASNDLAVFDYENNKDYRLAIAGEDNMIYVYDRSGIKVKGWNLFHASGKVKDQIRFFRVRGKDYLVAADDRSVYLLDRTGNIRVNLKEAVTKAGGSAFGLMPGPDPYIVCTSPNGTLINIFFDGTVKKYSIRSFSKDHLFDLFDLDGDALSEYIFIDQGVLYVYDDDKTELFTKTFDTKDLKGPYSYVFTASDRKTGVYEQAKQMIYIFNKTGDITNGFPLKGGDMFTFGKLSNSGGWSFIFNGQDNFLYNYDFNVGIK